MDTLCFIGHSAAARLIREEIASAARSDAKVLITGETGVGKDVIARLIHRQSRRQQAPIAMLNCAGLPDTLIESELFGHERGSFTGAYRDKPGILEAASHGTVFLDEVGEMSARMQAVLLRFLETGELQRVGADRAHGRANVRIIAATNRDLDAEIEAGRFRQDLFYRLNVLRIDVPPLRDRREDIAPLLEHYLEEYCRHHRVPRPAMTPAAQAHLMAYDWPGNVRQLKNVVEQIVVRGEGTPVTIAELPLEVRGESRRSRGGSPQAPYERMIEDRHAARVDEDVLSRIVESGESFWSAAYAPFMSRDLTRTQLRSVVERTLERTSGNYRLVVRMLNMPDSDYKRFLAFLRKHDCQPPFRSYRRNAAAPAAERSIGESFPYAASA